MNEVSADDLADYLVQLFNGLDGLPVKFKAENPEVVEIAAEQGDWVVKCIAFAESEDAEDRGDMCREELQVDVYVHGPLSETFKKKQAVRLVRKLRRALRLTEFEFKHEEPEGDEDATTTFRWDRNETVNGLFDLDALTTKNQFLSMFRATYFNFG